MLPRFLCTLEVAPSSTISDRRCQVVEGFGCRGEICRVSFDCLIYRIAERCSGRPSIVHDYHTHVYDTSHILQRSDKDVLSTILIRFYPLSTKITNAVSILYGHLDLLVRTLQRFSMIEDGPCGLHSVEESQLDLRNTIDF